MKILYKGYIYEARNLNRISNYMNREHKSNVGNEPALKDNDVVTVYHGIAHLHNVAKILTTGIDGSVAVPRKDSYENIENPKGLFVSPTLKTAEYFANSGYLIEFNCKVSDLEAPLWNKEDSDDVVNDREGVRAKLREKHPKSNTAFVNGADRPELAAIFSKGVEPQALFVGKLQPNQIKAVWYDPSRDLSSNFRDASEEKWERISRQSALKQVTKVDEKDLNEIKNIDLGILPEEGNP